MLYKVKIKNNNLNQILRSSWKLKGVQAHCIIFASEKDEKLLTKCAYKGHFLKFSKISTLKIVYFSKLYIFFSLTFKS